MPIERHARNTARPAPSQTRMACLDCPDCTGACWSRFELGFLPDTVLHPPRNPSA